MLVLVCRHWNENGMNERVELASECDLWGNGCSQSKLVTVDEGTEIGEIEGGSSGFMLCICFSPCRISQGFASAPSGY